MKKNVWNRSMTYPSIGLYHLVTLYIRVFAYGELRLYKPEIERLKCVKNTQQIKLIHFFFKIQRAHYPYQYNSILINKMVNVSQHKTEQKKELAKTNIKLQMAKQIFSEEFSQVLHKFSKEHYEEPLKTFRQSWTTWISENDIQKKMRTEIERMRTNNFSGTDEEITQKIYTSARFYYRKKEKRAKKLAEDSKEQQKEKKPKPYIGFSKEFIQLMDNEIKTKILQKADTDDTKKTEAIIKMNQKQAFHTFTLAHVNEISLEFGRLKIKYDELEEIYVAKEIAHKLKKAYQNRFYSICKILNGIV
jgi:hypothetical protein